MSKNPGICQICLRTNKKLKAIDAKLSEFHDELCDYTSYSVNALNSKYCAECAYLLTKLYNFKNKCVMAVKIYRDWKRSKAADKKPLNLLFTLLPPSSFGFWTPDRSKIYLYQSDESVLPSDSNAVRIETASNNIQSSQPYIVVVPIESIVDSQNGEGVHNQEFQEIEITNIANNVKLETECEDLKELNMDDLITFKSEESTKLNSFEEILFNDESNIETMRDVKLQNDDVEENVLEDSSDDDNLDSKKECVMKNESEKCFINDKVERNQKNDCKISLDELANVIDKDEVINDNSSKQKSVTKTKTIDNNTKKKPTSFKTKKIISKDDSKKRSATKKKEIDKDVKHKKQRFHTAKDIIAELTNDPDSDTTDDSSDKKKTKRWKKPFNKERLKAELKVKFASCGELKSDDGIVIDKQFIINAIDDKVTEFLMRQLWKAVYGKNCIKPKALKLFKCIQNKYKNEYESVFDIEFLNTKEKMMEEFQKRKTYECYINAEFKCEMCYQGFKHEKKLEYHKKCHDESAGAFTCSICNVRHKHKKNLISHLNSHEAVYKCKLCPLVTYYKISMVNHYQQHNGVKYRCEPCDVTFASQSSYRTHVSYRHARGHVCTACGRAFCTPVGLKWHATRAHQNEAPPAAEVGAGVRCERCSLAFPSQEVYLRHVRVTHEAVTRGRPAGSGSTYNIPNPRMCRPRKKPVMTCRVCNAVGSSIGWLTLHFRIEHPSTDMALMYSDKQNHLCDVCGKGFTTIYTLRAHMNTHTGARPFACSLCPARFPRALSLRQHRLLHLPPSRSCDRCGKKFRSQSNLTNHMRFHIGDRRYKCKICGKGFLHRGTLNEHVRGVHHNVRRVRKRGVTEPGVRGLPLSTEEQGD